MKKKVKLTGLQVQSFVTALTDDEKQMAKGGDLWDAVTGVNGPLTTNGGPSLCIYTCLQACSGTIQTLGYTDKPTCYKRLCPAE